MELFLSTYVNKVDRKGRVSVPATFRALLMAQRFPGIVVFRSYRFDALDAGGMDWMEELTARLDTLDQFSDEHENLATVLFGGSQRLPFDSEGRILLPQDLAAHAHIGDSAAFIGLGKSFQIWEPGRLDEHRATLLERARRQGTQLPALPAAGRRA